MLVMGMNDNLEAARELASFLVKMAPDVAYLSIPTRPPAEKSIRAPDEATINLVYQTVSQQVRRVELLTGYEGNAFASTGDLVEDLLSISAVHPLREDAVAGLLSKSGADWEQVQRLLDEGRLVQTEYQGRKFYLRGLKAE